MSFWGRFRRLQRTAEVYLPAAPEVFTVECEGTQYIEWTEVVALDSWEALAVEEAMDGRGFPIVRCFGEKAWVIETEARFDANTLSVKLRRVSNKSVPISVDEFRPCALLTRKDRGES